MDKVAPQHGYLGIITIKQYTWYYAQTIVSLYPLDKSLSTG